MSIPSLSILDVFFAVYGVPELVAQFGWAVLFISAHIRGRAAPRRPQMLLVILIGAIAQAIRKR